MAFSKWPDKDPEAIKDYAIDWTALLVGAEVIDTSTWAITPVSTTSPLVDGTSSIVDGVTTVWLSGGEEGVTYSVVNHIVTDRGMEDDRTIQIKVKTQ